MLAIHSIYLATEGEGVKIGTPQIFVRFQGCSIGCLNCDSKETWEFDENYTQIENVITQIEEQAGDYPRRIKRVSITGGDPLHPKHLAGVIELAGELKKCGYYINIEAAGTRAPDELFDIVDFVSFDFKTPSTGVKTNIRLLEKIISQYQEKSQIKSVIADKKDFEFVYDVYSQILEKFDHLLKTPWVLTPCYEPHEDFPKDRFIEIFNLNQEFGSPFRVIGQQHKWVFGPEKKNV